MKDKKILKKWWFWVIAGIVVLGLIGSLTQSSDIETSTANTQEISSNNSSLPQLNPEEYEGQEGLIVYKQLKDSGYSVDAEFENEALTDINGEASSVFEPLDPENTKDRQSVDKFVVGSLAQNGDSVTLTVVLQSQSN